MTAGTIDLAAGRASARIALAGAEPVAWRVGDAELLWSGDPAHWNRHAPILFPVVGACAGGEIRVGGRAYPMPRHGFARDSAFVPVARGPDSVTLRLADSAATRARFPFAFTLDVTAALTPSTLALDFTVGNPGPEALVYALGFHPAFPWPFAGGVADDYRVRFDADEDASVPDLTVEGLLRPGSRRLPLAGRDLPLSQELFAQDALVMRDVRSRVVRFVAPSGAAIALATEDFPHAALWTKPGAPFLSLEAWTGYADPEGFSGDVAEKPSMRILAPGAAGRHRVALGFEPGP